MLKRKRSIHNINKKEKKKVKDGHNESTQIQSSIQSTSKDELKRHVMIFLKSRQQHSENTYQNVIHHFLFQMSSISSSDNDDNTQSEDHKKHSFQDSTVHLCQYLMKSQIQEDTASSDELELKSVVITRQQVASLLFPWAVQTLLYETKENNKSSSFSMEELWNALNSSYNLLSLDNKTEDGRYNYVLQQQLSLGSLNKLVPFALKMAFHAEIELKIGIIEKKEVSIVTKCLNWMMEFDNYRPNMEHICTMLFPLLDSLLMNSRGSHDDTTNMTSQLHQFVTDQQYKILYKIMTMVHSRLESRCSNPKKTFQMMATKECIVSLAQIYQVYSSTEHSEYKNTSNIQDVVKRIVRLAFFDAQHHLDGFRSMNLSVPCLNKDIQQPNSNLSTKSEEHSKKNAKMSHEQSYQKSLLQSLDNILSSIVDDNDEANSKMLVVVRLLPVLLEEFILESSKADDMVHRKATRVDMTAKIQLRLWAHVLQPIFRRFQIGTETRLTNHMQLELKTIHQSLELLLKYDCYLPSFSDPNSDHLKYLEAVGESLLSLAERVKDVHGTDVLKQFKNLLDLNHHIYHTKLTRIICIATASSDVSQQIDLIGYLCKTYEKLRQMQYFLDCMIQSRIMNYTTSITSHIINEDNFRKVLIDSIKSVPQGQLKTLFSLMDDYTLKAKNLNDGSLDFVVDLYVTMLEGLNVDEFNAATLQSYCNNTERNIITELLVKKNDGSLDFNSTSTDNALHLLGWIIRKNTTSIFWLNDSDDVDSFLELHFDIISALNHYTSTKRKRSGALQHLACHRLIQLHSLIYQKEQTEAMLGRMCDESNHQSSKALIDDARTLADFIIDSASKRCARDRRGASWKLVCENIGVISIYADESHIEKFLLWFIHALGFGLNIGEKDYQDEEQAIINVLHDASFFELPSLSKKSTSSTFSVIEDILSQDITTFIPSYQSCCTKVKRLFQSPSGAIDPNLAAPISRMLQFLISMRSNYSNSADSFMITYGVLLISSRTLKTLAAGSCGLEFLELVESCNSLLLSTLKHVYNECTGKNSMTEVLLIHFVKILKVFLRPNYATYIGITNIIHAVSSMAAQILHLCSIHEGEEQYIHMCSILSDNSDGEIDDMKVKIVVTTECARLTYRKLKISDIENDQKPRAVHLLRTLKKIWTDLVNDESAIDSLFIYFLPFAADTLYLRHLIRNPEVESTDMNDLNIHSQVILRKVLSLLKDCYDTIGDHLERSCFYFLTSVIGRYLLSNDAVVVLKFEVQSLVLLQYNKRSGIIHPLLDTAYSSMCAQCTMTELHELIAGLMVGLQSPYSNIDDEYLSSILYCLHIMILSTTESEKVKVISQNIRQLIGPLFHLLKPERGNESKMLWSLHVERIFGLLQTLLSKSDVFVIKGHDYGSIFSAIDSILLGKCAKENPSVFIMACELVSSMLKVNRKLMYGCVPSLTNTLRSILSYVMTLSLPEDDEIKSEYENSVHCVVMLFQLIPEHKEVFKKHMMYLVLYFVECIQFTLNLWIKSQLEPVLFHLLDTLSEFELKQLGTFMKPSDKSTFAILFQSYNKNKFSGGY